MKRRRKFAALPKSDRRLLFEAALLTAQEPQAPAFPLTCLPPDLADSRMLRSRGHRARLLNGVSNVQETISVIGGRALVFTVPTSFPASRAQ